MNILVVSESSWNDKDSFGNSLNNWFSNWKDNFAHFFVRKLIPNNSIAHNYYNLTSKDIAKGILKFNIKGLTFTQHDLPNIKSVFEKEYNEEQKSINKIHSRKSKFIYLLNDMLWISQFWFNKRLKKFIDNEKPDIIFALTKNAIILKPIYRYCTKKYGTKLVLFATDEMLTQYNKTNFPRKHWLIKNFNWALNTCDLLYCSSEIMSKYYYDKFQIPSRALTKGCTHNLPVKASASEVIKLTYAGNLFYGRADVLLKIAETIKKNQLPFQLNIYTSCTDSSILDLFLDYASFLKVYKSVCYENVMEAMNLSDYVLVVESFDSEIINEVKFSYSTKIIDALQSGSGVVAVGPYEDNTIFTLSNINGVFSITDLSQISKELEYLANSNEERDFRANQIREYAIKNLNIDEIRRSIREDFCNILNNK